jgi:hypothetical protein
VADAEPEVSDCQPRILNVSGFNVSRYGILALIRDKCFP